MKYNKGIIATVLCVSMILTSIVPSFSSEEDITVSSEAIVLSDPKLSTEDEGVLEDKVEIATTSQAKEEFDENESLEAEPEEDISTEDIIEITAESTSGDEIDFTSTIEIETSIESTEIILITESESEMSAESIEIVNTAEDLADTLVATESSIVELEIVATATISDIAEFDMPTEILATVSEIEALLIATNSATSVDSKNDVFVGTTPSTTKKQKRRFVPGYISPGFSVDIVDRDGINNGDSKNNSDSIDNNLFGAGEIPAKYDSREHKNAHGVDIVPPSRNQNPYGDCWAFGTIGMFETSIRSKNLITSSTDEGGDLSELALALFTIEGLDGVTDNNNFIDNPGVEGADYNCLNYDYYMDVKHIPRASMSFADSGGNEPAALLMAATYMGVVSENDFPHTEENINAILNEMRTTGLSDARKPYAFNKNRYELINADFLNKNDRLSVKEAIMKYGSVGIGYCENRDEYNCHVNDGEWYYLSPDKAYKILDDGSCGEEINLWPNHAVTIVGWDDTVPFNYFFYDGDVYEDRDGYVIASYSVIDDDTGLYYPSYRTTESRVENDGAWLLRNSWGDENDKANHGYFWLPYDDLNLDSLICAADVEEAGKYKYNYHYDTTLALDTYDYVGRGKLANIFKVSSEMNQILEAVNIAWQSANIDYEIQIYTNENKMNDPEDGVLVFTKSVHNASAGIKTIELDENILVKKDTYFSIIVKANTLHTKIFYDCTHVDADSDRWSYNEVHLGESWENDNGTWEDLNTTPALTIGDKIYGYTPRIRGLTNEAKIITFNAGGGTGTMPDQGGKVNTTIKISDNKFTRRGYNFVKWVDSDGKEHKNGGDIVLDKDITLTALWEYAGGGSGGSSGSSGGDNGMGPIPQILQNYATSLEVTTVKSISIVVNSDTSNWIYEPTTNKWKLNVSNENGQSVSLSNGFYVVNKTIKTIINGVSIPNVVSDTYYFDVGGNMVTGWVKTKDGKWYFFENAKTVDEGKMVTGWKNIDGYWYYFIEDGSMLTNGRTPEGYQAGIDGKIIRNLMEKV